jgi:hypothetical protein
MNYFIENHFIIIIFILYIYMEDITKISDLYFNPILNLSTSKKLHEYLNKVYDWKKSMKY